MRVTLVGAGRLATNLGRELCARGVAVQQVWSRTEAAASQLAKLTGSEPCTDIAQIRAGADVYIFAVKDAGLANLINQMPKATRQAVYVHTAGSMPLDVFAGKAAHYGVMWPLQTFSKERETTFAAVPTFTEASDLEAEEAIASLTATLGSRCIELTSRQRRGVHLAAVFACNFANHCYAIAEQLLQQSGTPFDVLLPLIDETAEKVHRLSPTAAQTGPAVRWDENVIHSQLAYLQDTPYAEIYKTLSESIHSLAAQGQAAECRQTK